MKKIAAIVIVMIAVIAGGWHFLKQTPQYSLYKFGQALQQHDADTAFQYVDVDAVVDNLMAKVVRDIDSKPTSSSNPWEQMGNNFAKGLATLMLPAMKEAARAQLRAAIQEPAAKGSNNNFKVFAGASSWREFEVEKQGKIAIVTKKSDKDFSVKLSQGADGHWKIVELMSKDVQPLLPQKK